MNFYYTSSLNSVVDKVFMLTYREGWLNRYIQKYKYYFLENVCHKHKTVTFQPNFNHYIFTYIISNILKTVFKLNFQTEVILNRIENAINIPNGCSELGTSTFAGVAFRK